MLNNVDSLENENDILKQNIHFQEELQNILTLLVKENSIQVIAEEILIRAVKNCDGLFGVIYHNYEDNKLSFTKYDPNNNLEHINDFKKEINANLSFINKWLANHSKPLIGTNKQNNIGNTLNSIFQSSTILITPCLSNDKLFATLIIGKKKGKFSKFDVATTTQFASLFAFGVSSINTKKLNITLEKKLLQAQKLETIGKLSSGMAHDFNNLLSGIFGSVDLLKKRLPNEPKFTKLVDNIEQCSIRARDLTKGLLSYGKPTAKRKEIIKPTSLLGDLIKVISSTFPKGIDIITNIEENLRIYRKLKKLDPENNNLYREKISYYKKKASEAKEIKLYPEKFVKIEEMKWWKDGFGSIMMADFTIKNNLPGPVKDIEVICSHSAPSGTVIDYNTRIIYERIGQGRTKKFKDFNMGFIDDQVVRTGCKVSSVVVLF